EQCEGDVQPTEDGRHDARPAASAPVHDGHPDPQPNGDETDDGDAADAQGNRRIHLIGCQLRLLFLQLFAYQVSAEQAEHGGQRLEREADAREPRGGYEGPRWVLRRWRMTERAGGITGRWLLRRGRGRVAGGGIGRSGIGRWMLRRPLI